MWHTDALCGAMHKQWSSCRGVGFLGFPVATGRCSWMCSERSSLVNLGCKWQLSQEARRSVQLSQLCAKVQCAAENLGFTLHDTATGRTAISTLRATDEAVDSIGKAVVAGKSQIENGSEHSRPSDGDWPPRSSRGGNAEMENPSSEHAESIKRLGPWQWLGSQGRPISL